MGLSKHLRVLKVRGWAIRGINIIVIAEYLLEINFLLLSGFMITGIATNGSIFAWADQSIPSDSEPQAAAVRILLVSLKGYLPLQHTKIKIF